MRNTVWIPPVAPPVPAAPAAPAAPGVKPPPKFSVKEAERQLIIRALEECDGNRTRAARKLGMSRRTLHRKLHAYQLENLFRKSPDDEDDDTP